MVEKKKAEKDKKKALEKCRKLERRAGRLAAKTDSVQQLKKKIHDLSEDKESCVRSLENEVVDMQGHVERIAAERDRLLDAKKGLEEDLKKLGYVERIAAERDRLLEANKGLKEDVKNLRYENADKADIQAERDRLLDHNNELQQDLTMLQAQVEQVKEGNSAVHVCEMLGVSPGSMKQVEASSKKGAYLESWTLEEATPTVEGQRSEFLERVQTVLTPAIEKICSMAKFKGRRTDIPGVARLLLRKIAGRKQKAKRQLFNGGAPRGISHDLHSLLKEMSTAWRKAFRNQERQAAARLLQITLQAIPKRRGKCVCVLR